MVLDLANFQSSVDTATMRGGDASGTIQRLVTLLTDLVSRNGYGDEEIMTKGSGSTMLPGFYESITEWDFMVMRRCRLIAVIRWDAVPSPAQENEHHRAAEVVYAAHALQAARRSGMLGEPAYRPFVGWLMLVEDATGSRSPVAERSPHFPVRPEFQNASYLQRYDLLCRKLMQESLYTAASVITSPATAARNGKFAEVSEPTGLKNFITTFAAHIAAEAAR